VKVGRPDGKLTPPGLARAGEPELCGGATLLIGVALLTPALPLLAVAADPGGAPPPWALPCATAGAAGRDRLARNSPRLVARSRRTRDSSACNERICASIEDSRASACP